ncbi:MAG TPA: DUF4386 domain-containing protein [Acidimicrobiia bacterium]|nr:DUF4386 domain-containing protein [Acidimicrobiia bacterium]
MDVAATDRREPGTSPLRKTGRTTGLWYLALGITGILSYLLIRPQIFVAGDPAATFTNLVDREALARLGLSLELAMIVIQAALAVSFYKLFRVINHTAAWALAAFGMANAIAILGSASYWATSLSVANNLALAPGGDTVATIQLLHQLSSNTWGVAAVFFGLWLIPMGHIVLTSGLMPKWLGRILIVGGVGYVASALVKHGVVGSPTWLVEGLTVPATVGEFWMIGYLLIKGVKTPSSDPDTVNAL